MTVVRMIDDWVPLPAAILAELGWAEGDSIQVEIAGDCLILTKLEGHVHERAAPPSKRRSLKESL